MELSQRSKTIAVVDDDDLICQLLEQLITSSSHHRVQTFSDPATAAAALREHPANLVITDIMMPGMSGTDLLREVKGAHPDTEVILLTGHSSYETAVEGLGGRAYDYLEKPVRADRMMLAIENALARQELSTQLTGAIGEIASLNSGLRERLRAELLVEAPAHRLAGARTALAELARELAPVLEGNGQASGVAAAVKSALERHARLLDGRTAKRPSVDLAGIVRDRCRRLEGLFPRLSVAYAGIAGSFAAPADAAALERAVSTLMGLLIEVMQERGRLGVSAVTEAGQLVVTFTGPGERDLVQLFGSGERASDPGRRLGALLVRRAVDEHGGRLELITGEPGRAGVALHLPGEGKQLHS